MGLEVNSCDQSQDLNRGDHHDTEHQMAQHLGVAPHPRGLPAVVILEIGIHAFGTRPLVVAEVVGHLVTDESPISPFLCQVPLETGPDPRVIITQWGLRTGTGQPAGQ